MTGGSLLVRGGTVVDERQARQADVLVTGGRVAAIAPPGSLPAASGVVEATGLHVLPGLVDAHVHFNEPGRTSWEGYATGSAAAAAGGITTVLDMPLNCHPPTLDLAALASKRAAVAGHSLVDYAHWGGLTEGSLDHLAAMHGAGVVGFKAFMCDSGLAEFPAVGDAVLREGMRRVARLGSVLALHAESDQRTAELGEQARRQGRRSPRAWAQARPPETESGAVARALELAAETRARVHVVHASTPDAVARVARARAAGVRATVETCPHYLCLTEADLDRLGPVAKCAPPLRSAELVHGLWQAVLAGQVQYIASDHSPCPPADKERGADDIWLAWGGISGVQTMLPLLLTEGVHARGLPLTALVRLVSAEPARQYGLWPRKGALAPGSDADMTLVDLGRAWTLGPGDLLTRWPLSPFVGRQLRAAVVATIVRGTVVYRDGQIVAPIGHGQLVAAVGATEGAGR